MNQLKDHISSKVNEKEEETKKCTQKFKHLLNLDILPDDLSISTMTIICKFNTKFNIQNIGKYLDLNINDIVSISYCDEGELQLRSLIKKPIRKRVKPIKKNSFYNQATLLIKSVHDKKEINTKIFKNGSVQMTGCKSIIGTIEVLNTLCIKLKKIKGIIDPNSLDKIILMPYVSDQEKLSIDAMYDFGVCMINSGFHIGFKIDREALYNILVEEKIEAKYDLDTHACVNIKYKYKNDDRRKISIFVFASGSIIITGATTCNHILEAYEFISMKLIKNYQKIRFVNTIGDKDDIRHFLKKEE